MVSRVSPHCLLSLCFKLVLYGSEQHFRWRSTLIQIHYAAHRYGIGNACNVVSCLYNVLSGLYLNVSAMYSICNISNVSSISFACRF